MAISYVATSNASGTTSASLSAPSGVRNGDLLLVFKSDRATSGTTSAPTGWTRVASAAAASYYRIEVFWAIYGQGTGNGPWSFTGTTRTLALCVAYRGVDLATPMDVTPSARVNASGTYGTTSITTVTDNAWVIAGYAFTANNYTWSAESVATSPTLAERTEAAYSTYMDIAVADGNKASAGATGASTATPSTAAVNGGALVALRPATKFSPPPFQRTWRTWATRRI